jgi:hypothetical protein
MLLSANDRKLFFELYIPLLGFANRYDGLNKRRRMDKAREILFGNPGIIEDFVKQNPEKLYSEELAVVADWRKFLKGTFVAIGESKDGTDLMFMGGKKLKIYRVLGLTENIMDLMQYGIGTMFDTVLLPWRGKIIWDGLCEIKQVILGRNYMWSFKDDYKNLKKAGKIVTSLP